jgi:hypothetical protein
MSLLQIKSLILMATFLAGLGFAACKTTPKQSTPLPPQPETSETKDTSNPHSRKQKKNRKPARQLHPRPLRLKSQSQRRNYRIVKPPLPV